MHHTDPPASPPALTADDVIALGLLYEARIARLRSAVWRWRGIAAMASTVALLGHL